MVYGGSVLEHGYKVLIILAGVFALIGVVDTILAGVFALIGVVDTILDQRKNRQMAALVTKINQAKDREDFKTADRITRELNRLADYRWWKRWLPRS
jgi:hypothetical protein